MFKQDYTILHKTSLLSLKNDNEYNYVYCVYVQASKNKKEQFFQRMKRIKPQGSGQMGRVG